MSMTSILLIDAKPFEQVVNTLSMESPVICSLVKNDQMVSGKKEDVKDHTHFYMYVTQGLGQKILIVTESVCYYCHQLNVYNTV